MNESDFKRDLVKRLQAERAFTLRFEDRFTAGIPDLLVGFEGRGLWVEVKLDGRPLEPARWKAFKMQQALACAQLGQALRFVTPVYYLCYDDRTRRCSWAPAALVLDAARNETGLLPHHLHEGRGMAEILTTLRGGTF